MEKKFKCIESKGTNKLNLDQYYTSEEDMNYCVNKTLDVLQEKGYSISEFLEPSAGQGVFSNYLATTGLNVIAIDIDPKQDNIIKADFLTYDIEYKKDRLIIGNPPFGSKLNLAQKFFKKSVQIGDYISFILPISQLNNTNSTMYEFDLIYSEDLGELIFSGNRKVHCCLNVYVRPKNGLNKKKVARLKDVEIVRIDSKRYKDFEFDIRMCYWGNAAGKILKDGERYSGEYKIKIHNEALKDRIITVLTNVDWKKELNTTAMPMIQKYHIVNVLKREIEEIN